MSSSLTATDELIEFISDLRRTGYNIGVEQYVSAHRLLCALVAETGWLSDPQWFGGMLSSVLCSSPEEQYGFPEHYARWLNTQPAVFRPVDQPSPAPPAPPKPTPRSEIKGRRFSWLQTLSRVGLVIGGLVVLIIIGFVLSNNLKYLLEIPVTPNQTSTDPKPPSGYTAKSIIAVVGGVLGLCGTLIWFFRYRLRLELKKWRTSASQRPNNLKVKGASDQLIRFLPLRRIAQEMRRYRPFDATDLDVPKTIEETIRAGIFTPAFTSRKALPEYLVLIDRKTFADQQARLVANIVAHLGKNDVPIEHYFFREDPRLCWKDGREAQFLTLGELALRHSRHYLLIFSDGDGFFDSLTGHPYRWLESFTTWPTRLLLTSEVQPGDFRDWILSELGFRVLPLSKSGLIAISESVDGGTPRQKGNISERDRLPVALRERTGYWLKSHPPRAELINELCYELKSFLGNEGYYWLSACAIYPSLYLDLTFYLGFKLITPENLFDTYSRLVRLPWFRSGSMPDWLRGRLIIDLDEKSEHTIRVALEDLLIGSLKEPDGFVLPVVTAPQVDEPAFGWSRLKAKVRALFRTKLAEDILRKQLDDNTPRDYVALAFMSGRKPSHLSVNLPQEVYPVLYQSNGPVIDRTLGWTIITTNLVFITMAVTPLLMVRPNPITILMAIVVWVSLMGLTLWAVRELMRARPLTSSTVVPNPELPRESAATLTGNLIPWIKDFISSRETEDNEVGFGQTILDSSVTASAASSNVKEDLVFANTVARVTPIQQLRGPVGDFVGREQEVDEVLQAFNSGRNVIITGIGGTGKTELAFLVAARLSDQYPDGQIVVEMGGTNDRPRDPVDAISFCIRALTGVEQRLPDGLTELVASYRTVLEGKRVLILLDNAFDTNQIREFVPPPGCGLLITSRHAITLPGVTLVMLEALKPAEASKLLRDIAPLVPVHIADEICELCGYLPLAIRAAGSLLVETQDLAPSDFVAQLRDERLRSKQLGIGGIDTRVEASFNLSYQLLEPQAALIFRQLSIFPASFDTDAEETICEDKRYRQLRRLVRRNLVLYSRDTRRYYLHNVARTFSESRLSETERQVIGARHASYYVNILRQAEDHYLKGDTSVMEALRIFDSEWDNIQTGWSWANREFKNNSLAVQLVNDYPLAAENLLDLRQDPRDRILWLEAALQAAQQLNDVKAESYHLGNLGASHVYLGDLDRATMYLEQQLALARKLNDFPGQEYALRNIGFVYSSRGETDRAIEFYQQSLVLARELGDVRKEAITLGHLGVNYFSREEYLRALDYFQQSMVLARQIGDRRGEGQVLGRLGVTYAALGETKRAIEYYQQCLAVTRELGDRQVEGTVLFSLSQAFEQLGNYTQAIDLAQQALEILEQIESPQASKVREQIKKLQH